MAIQIWMGSELATMAEKRLPGKSHMWRNGLVVQVRRMFGEKDTGRVVDVAYLQDSGAEEETVEKSVPPNRIRMLLGGDDKLPETLEEARLEAMGEEVVRVEQHGKQEPVIDENTGLSVWGTVEIRKTTVRNEVKEERERARAKRREEQARLEEEKRKAEERRMEEDKAGNAEDSALGAYDVWSSGKAGYKGVDISQETKLSVADTAKSLAAGEGQVTFKKKKGKKKKQNRRTTSADDD
uniref:Uncharacterized protein n=1 Tax=Cyclophora tenuis TaxID=216820 RepID=A0A7S1D6P0_CYCTE